LRVAAGACHRRSGGCFAAVVAAPHTAALCGNRPSFHLVTGGQCRPLGVPGAFETDVVWGMHGVSGRKGWVCFAFVTCLYAGAVYVVLPAGCLVVGCVEQLLTIVLLLSAVCVVCSLCWCLACACWRHVSSPGSPCIFMSRDVVWCGVRGVGRRFGWSCRLFWSRQPPHGARGPPRRPPDA